MGESYEILKTNKHYFWNNHDRGTVEPDSSASHPFGSVWIVSAFGGSVFGNYKAGGCGADWKPAFGPDAPYVCAGFCRASRQF